MYLLVELQHEVDEIEDVRAASFGHGEDGSLIVDCFALRCIGMGGREGRDGCRNGKDNPFSEAERDDSFDTRNKQSTNN